MGVIALLVAPGAAIAHVSISPGLLESGREQTLRIELPELRPNRRPETLEVSAPGVRTITSDLAGRRGLESRWRVRVDVRAEPGPIVLLLRARFADRRSVTVRQATTVLPAASTSSPARPLLLAGTGVLGVASVLLFLLLVRRARFK